MPAEGRPAITARLIMRDVRCDESRLIHTIEPFGKLRREIDIHQSRDTEAAEQAALALRSPDDAAIDDCSGLDLFVRPDFDIGLNNRAFLNNGVIADD